jgi:hypothetical protein
VWADDRSGPLKALRDLVNPLPWRGRDPNLPARLEQTVPGNIDSARFLLSEAEALFDTRRDQALRAEARATTLQGSVGIALGLVLTGTAFLLDPTKVADRGWRLALTVVIAALLTCLAMAGYLATRATVKLLRYIRPGPEAALARATMNDVEAHRDRALSLLISYEENGYFSSFKIKQIHAAGLWYRDALGCFAALSLLLLIYAGVGPIPGAGK